MLLACRQGAIMWRITKHGPRWRRRHEDHSLTECGLRGNACDAMMLGAYQDGEDLSAPTRCRMPRSIASLLESRCAPALRLYCL